MLLTDEEVDTICTSISMKPGHRKRFPALLQRARIQAEREEKIRQDQREREERMRQDQAEREEKMRQENEDETAERKREAKAHERRLENARRRKELEAAETGAETQVATKEKVVTSSSIVRSSVAIAQTELPQGKLFGGIGLTMSFVALLWLSI